MAGTTTYLGISYPTNTDYVKDGASAIQTVATGFDSAVAIPTYNNQTGTTYTFALTDVGKTVTASNASAQTYTIPPTASVAWAANTTLNVVNLGAGVVTFDGGAGVTVTNTANTLAQYQSARLIRTALNAWIVVPASGIATSPGTTLIKTQTIGSAVSSVTVTGAFSATYDNYKILISGGGSSAASNMTMILGSTTTGYYWANRGNNWANTGFQSAGSALSSWGEIARAETSAISANIELENPFASDETVMRNATVGVITSGFMQWGGGFLNNTTSYTSFTIAPSTGTYSGGTIYVYGYNK